MRRRSRSPSGSEPVVDAPPVPTIELDYPVHPRPRYGHGMPPHPVLAERIGRHVDRYEEHLRGVLAHEDRLALIPLEPHDDQSDPWWRNVWIPGLDAALLYSYVANRDPKRYLEVGSGTSTRFVHRAIVDHDLSTHVTSIDPAPRVEIDALCDEVLRTPLEATDLSVFDDLTHGDVVFVDNSHRALPNSDATVALLEVLPRLRPGVLVGFHDIFLPDDYPEEFAGRFYSEQYVLAGMVMSGDDLFQIELPAWYCATHSDLSSVLNSLWSRRELEGVERHGASFWVTTGIQQ